MSELNTQRKERGHSAEDHDPRLGSLLHLVAEIFPRSQRHSLEIRAVNDSDVAKVGPEDLTLNFIGHPEEFLHTFHGAESRRPTYENAVPQQEEGRLVSLVESHVGPLGTTKNGKPRHRAAGFLTGHQGTPPVHFQRVVARSPSSSSCMFTVRLSTPRRRPKALSPSL